MPSLHERVRETIYATDGESLETLKQKINAMILDELLSPQQMDFSVFDQDFTNNEAYSQALEAVDTKGEYGARLADIGATVRELYTKHPAIGLSPETWDTLAEHDTSGAISTEVGFDIRDLATSANNSVDYSKDAVYEAPDVRETRVRQENKELAQDAAAELKEPLRKKSAEKLVEPDVKKLRAPVIPQRKDTPMDREL